MKRKLLKRTESSRGAGPRTPMLRSNLQITSPDPPPDRTPRTPPVCPALTARAQPFPCRLFNAAITLQSQSALHADWVW
jgi:hypothetical protein